MHTSSDDSDPPDDHSNPWWKGLEIRLSIDSDDSDYQNFNLSHSQNSVWCYSLK